MDGSQDDGELARLLGISRAFKLSKALNLAGKLDLFTLCSTPGGLTLQQICDRLGFAYSTRPDASTLANSSKDESITDSSSGGSWPYAGVRGCADWLDLLVALQVLQREDDMDGATILTAGDGPTARYSPHCKAAPYLVSSSPDSITGILALNNDRSSPLFGYLEDALRHGAVPQQAHAQVPDIHTTFNAAGGSQAGGAQHFALGMLGASIGNFRRLAQVMDFSNYHTIVDVGGSTGCCCVALCQAHGHLTAITCDLPAVHEVAQQYVDQHSMMGRVKVMDLDFFSSEPFPEADVIVMGMVLHDWGLAKKQVLIKKARAALRPGGALVAVESLIDDERRQASGALASSLNMLVEFGREVAFDFSFREFCSWTQQAGFTRMECFPLVGSSAAAVAYV